MNKKGGIVQVIAIILVLVIIIAIGFSFILFSGAWTYSFNTITNNLINIPATNNVTNISYFASVSFGQINSSFNQLQWWSYMIILSMIAGVILSFYLVKSHPGWWIFFIILFAIGEMFSIYIANAYEGIYNSGSFVSTQLQSFAGSSFIMLNLPIITGIICLIGGILMFIPRDEQGGV